MAEDMQLSRFKFEFNETDTDAFSNNSSVIVNETTRLKKLFRYLNIKSWQHKFDQFDLATIYGIKTRYF